MVRKAVAAAVVNKFLFTAFLVSLTVVPALSQTVPEDELQVNINTYFDNFRLYVAYPSVNITKKISGTTSITGRYLVDIISSASMRSIFKVDGVTSATPNQHGGGDDTPDELRNQFGLGVTQSIGQGLLSLNGMYSREHDYSSKTFAGTISYPFAKKNTVLQLGFAGNWDKVFPQTRTWIKDRKTLEFDLGLTQILSKNIITQLNASYIDVTGYMLDGYQVVKIINPNSFRIVEPIEPESRIRRSAGIRTNFAVSKKTTLELGYRYYWDTWDIKSHTFSGAVKTHLSDILGASIELRRYDQTKAFFFKPEYFEIEQFMTVESKLNSGYTNEVSLELTLNGSKNIHFPLLNNEKMQFNAGLGFYQRHTDTPDWFTRYLNLYAYLFSFGFRYFY
jgi:hypothetical protein